jgi:NADH-quinone oxidoreductase subunit J
MNTVFYVSSIVAVISTVLVITRLNAVHALLYFIVSLLSVALIFFTIGAPFAAALEVIIYAGAIMVLFLFVVMTLNLGPRSLEQENQWLSPETWSGPAVLSIILITELIYLLAGHPEHLTSTSVIGPKLVGIALFGPYLLGVELASMLLLAGLIGAYHLGWRAKAIETGKSLGSSKGDGNNLPSRPLSKGDIGGSSNKTADGESS